MVVSTSSVRAALSTPMGGILLHEDCGTTAAELARNPARARTETPGAIRAERQVSGGGDALLAAPDRDRHRGARSGP